MKYIAEILHLQSIFYLAKLCPQQIHQLSNPISLGFSLECLLRLQAWGQPYEWKMLRLPPMKTMIIEEILPLRLRKAADLQEVVHVATNDVLLRLRASWNILRISLITEKGNLKILFPILSKIIDQIECTFSFKMSFALGFYFSSEFENWILETSVWIVDAMLCAEKYQF